MLDVFIFCQIKGISVYQKSFSDRNQWLQQEVTGIKQRDAQYQEEAVGLRQKINELQKVRRPSTAIIYFFISYFHRNMIVTFTFGYFL